MLIMPRPPTHTPRGVKKADINLCISTKHIYFLHSRIAHHHTYPPAHSHTSRRQKGRYQLMYINETYLFLALTYRTSPHISTRRLTHVTALTHPPHALTHFTGPVLPVHLGRSLHISLTRAAHQSPPTRLVFQELRWSAARYVAQSLVYIILCSFFIDTPLQAYYFQGI